MSKARLYQLQEPPLSSAGLAYIFPRVPCQLYSWWALQDCAQPPQRDGPRTSRAGTQIPDPPSREVADSILSRPSGEGRPAPVESLNLNPPSSPLSRAPDPRP
jgi:hypothetical protein